MILHYPLNNVMNLNKIFNILETQNKKKFKDSTKFIYIYTYIYIYIYI